MIGNVACRIRSDVDIQYLAGSSLQGSGRRGATLNRIRSEGRPGMRKINDGDWTRDMRPSQFRESFESKNDVTAFRDDSEERRRDIASEHILS